MSRKKAGLLGLFSGCVAPGGIQASGRLAWDAIERTAREHPPGVFGEPYRFCYGDAGQPEAQPGSGVHTPSKRGAVLAALAFHRRSSLVLVWHVSLLKLLPFFRARGARIVLFLHGTEVWDQQTWPMRVLLSQVDLFLSNSNYTWRRFADTNPRFGSAAHCTVALGIGARWEGLSPTPRTVPAALMLGRLLRSENYKGHREMLDAWPLVLERLPSAELWIAGDGDLRPDLEALAAQRGLANSTRFLGRVTEERKHDLIGQARCLALPSAGEGFGLVYLEGMRQGRPCLVSTGDAGREIVDPPRCGLAVDPARREDLAAAMLRLLETGTEWQHWSRSARERYERQFTADAFQQRLVTVLANAACPNPGPNAPGDFAARE